ncbi:MAG TPA: CBS domain-containing protein [Actinomycetota bacterium]|nr:CBS domain-containing protein [Actinomycetota bacterium]
MAKTAREIMTQSAECIGENDSILDAAKMMSKSDIGAMPICGEDNRLKGMLTDRDIVVKVIAEGRDPSEVKAGELGQGKPVTIGADDSIGLAIKTMADHQVRRLPVIDGHDLIGIVSIGDIAKNADEDDVGSLLELVSSGPANN